MPCCCCCTACRRHRARSPFAVHQLHAGLPSPTPALPLPPGSLHPLVSAWVLDKRELTQAEDAFGGGHHGSLTRPSQRRLEAFLEQCRRDVQARGGAAVGVGSCAQGSAHQPFCCLGVLAGVL